MESQTYGRRIAILDADALFVDSLTPRLESLGMQVQTSPVSPDVVLVDADRNGSAEHVVTDQPEAKHILLSSNLDERNAREAIQQGFHGAISKDTAASRLESAIVSVLEGDIVIEIKPSRHERPEATSMIDPGLTRRELEILEGIVDGIPSTEMAERMSVSTHTVRTHVQNLLAKLGAHSRVEAAAIAVRNRLVEGKR